MSRLSSSLRYLRHALRLTRSARQPGALRFDATSLPSATYTLGTFVVRWDSAHTGGLQISHGQAPERILWATIPGRNFVAAAHGHEQVRESRGHFRIRDHISATWTDQSVQHIRLADDTLTLSGELCAAQSHTRVGYRLSLFFQNETQLAFRLQFDHQQVNRATLIYASEPDEHFFGFGVQYSYFDQKGRLVPIFVQEQGVGRGLQPLTLAANLQAGAGGAWHTSYACVPHYLTSKLRSLFLECSEYVEFDLREPSQVYIQIFASELSGRIVYGESPAALIASYTAYTGRMPELPVWVQNGAIVGLQGGTALVRARVQQLQQHHVPLSAVWIQDWVGQRQTSFGSQLWWNWEVDQRHYPEWQALVAGLHSQGIRVLTYVNPLLVDVSTRPGVHRNLFQEACEHGYVVRTPAGQPYLIRITDFSACLVDLSDPAAYVWLKTVLLTQVLAAGIDGWMADFGEGLPYDAVLASGESAASYHNRYPEIWAQLQREVAEASGRQLLCFLRSGYTRSPGSASLFWLGDQLVSWDAYDGIKTAVMGLVSSGMSGFSLNHSDTGGYTSIVHPMLNYRRSKELLLRWIELSAFTAVLRTHEGNRPHSNHQIYSDPQSLAHMRRFASIYQALGDYRRALMREAATTGLPVVRHLWLHYPDDPNVYRLSYHQFLLGRDILVVPVLDPGARSVRAYLPAGDWIHLWTGTRYSVGSTGLRISIAAPIGQPGVLYRADGDAGIRAAEAIRAVA